MQRQTKQRQTGNLQMSETMTQPDSRDLSSINCSSLSYPAGFNKQYPFAFADYGKRQWTVLIDDNILEMPTEQFIALDWMDSCTQLVAEYAHIQVPRTKKSMAQPLTIRSMEVMQENATEKDISIWLVSQEQTQVVRQIVTGENPKTNPKKTGEDSKDCRCWSEFIKDNRVSMMRWKVRSEDNADREAIYEFKARTNEILNAARVFDYELTHKVFSELGIAAKTDICSELIRYGNLEKTADAAARRWHLCHAFTKEQRGIKNAINALGDTQIYTLAAMIYDPFTGVRRVRSDTGRPPGVRWLMRHIVGNTPFHRNGGVARSNIYHHGVKNFAAIKGSDRKTKKWFELTHAELQEVRAKRRDYIKAIRIVLSYMKQIADGEQKEGLFEFAFADKA